MAHDGTDLTDRRTFLQAGAMASASALATSSATNSDQAALS
jgi:hypothetical protein